MRCPKCDTTNSDFANTCLKCGHSFVQTATYESFVPDYQVAAPPPPTPEQLAAQAQMQQQGYSMQRMDLSLQSDDSAYLP